METGEVSRASPQVVKHSSPPSPPQFQKWGPCNVPAPVVTSGVTQCVETARPQPHEGLDGVRSGKLRCQCPIGAAKRS